MIKDVANFEEACSDCGHAQTRAVVVVCCLLNCLVGCFFVSAAFIDVQRSIYLSLYFSLLLLLLLTSDTAVAYIYTGSTTNYLLLCTLHVVRGAVGYHMIAILLEYVSTSGIIIVVVHHLFIHFLSRNHYYLTAPTRTCMMFGFTGGPCVVVST